METGFLTVLVDAVKSGQWMLVGAVALVGVVWGLRAFGGKWFPFLKTDRGGATLAVLSGVLTFGMTSIMTGAAVSFEMLVTGLEMGVTAAGGYVVLKKLFFPSDVPKVS